MFLFFYFVLSLNTQHNFILSFVFFMSYPCMLPSRFWKERSCHLLFVLIGSMHLSICYLHFIELYYWIKGEMNGISFDKMEKIISKHVGDRFARIIKLKKKYAYFRCCFVICQVLFHCLVLDSPFVFL